jgi:hypothetical protein
VINVMFPGYDFGYMGWMMIGSIIFWVLLVGLAVLAIIRLTPARERGDDAVAILKQRFARGEIKAEEYQLRRSLILGHKARGRAVTGSSPIVGSREFRLPAVRRSRPSRKAGSQGLAMTSSSTRPTGWS